MKPPADPVLSAPSDPGDAWADTEIDDSRERHAPVTAPEAARAGLRVPPRQLPPRRKPLPQKIWAEAGHLLLAALAAMIVAWGVTSHLGRSLLGAVLGLLVGLLVLWGRPALDWAQRRWPERPALHRRRKKPGRP